LTTKKLYIFTYSYHNQNDMSYVYIIFYCDKKIYDYETSLKLEDLV